MVSKLAFHPSEYMNRVVVNWLPLRLFSHTNCGWINPKMVLYNERKLFNTFNHKMLLKQSIIWKSTQGSCNSRLLYLLRTNIGYGRSNSIAFVHISAPSENRDFAPPPSILEQQLLVERILEQQIEASYWSRACTASPRGMPQMLQLHALALGTVHF